jgi:hypothetical protein
LIWIDSAIAVIARLERLAVEITATAPGNGTTPQPAQGDTFILFYLEVTHHQVKQRFTTLPTLLPCPAIDSQNAGQQMPEELRRDPHQSGLLIDLVRQGSFQSEEFAIIFYLHNTYFLTY